ncbi:MAG: hypothetical protein LBB05_00155 [Puniceicoccales bacterium]|jgi:hypothetical protein|nr:hypothetical protein [Puniceicoccales bacterium]
MENYCLHSICFFALINFHQCVEGGRLTRKNFNRFSASHTIETEENTKEIRHFSKVLHRQQRHGLKIKTNKRFQKYAKIARKELNMHGLNCPFIRRTRSSKIGTVPLYKLPNENK